MLRGIAITDEFVLQVDSITLRTDLLLQPPPSVFMSSFVARRTSAPQAFVEGHTSPIQEGCAGWIIDGALGLLFVQREDGVRSLFYCSFCFSRDVAVEVSSQTFAALPGILESVLNPSHGCQTASEEASRILRVTNTSVSSSTMQRGTIIRAANASMCICSSSLSPCP